MTGGPIWVSPRIEDRDGPRSHRRDEPTTLEPATVTQIANHITEIITSGTDNHTKALVETVVAKVTITAPDRLIPIFRIPQPTTTTNPQPPTHQQKPLSKQRFAQWLNRWRYLPLTRTRYKLLTCGFTTPQLAPALCVPPRLRTKPPWSLRERVDEHDIAELISAYRDGATAASLAIAHGVSLSSVKRLLHTAGARPRPSTRGPTKATSTTTYP